MASNVTLLAMRTAARQGANQETLDQANAFVTDTELNAVLNAWLEHVYRLKVRARSNYSRATQTITTASATSSYALSTDFLELISVDWQYTPSDVVPIYPYEEPERNQYRITPGWIRNYPVYYQLQNNNINFIPTPQSAYTVVVNYVPAYTALSADSDTFDGVVGFEHYAVYKATAYMLSKDDNAESAQYWEGLAMKVEQEIEAMAANRTAGLRRVPRVRRARKWGQGSGW